MDVKKLLDIVNKYLSLIIILPAILGGLWQIIELSRISFSFIRFFSVTQIIPDGLLILLFLLIFVFSLLFLIWVLEKYNKGDEVDDESNVKEGNIYHAILFLMLFFACSIAVIYFNIFIANNIENIFNLLIYLPINIIISLLAYGFLKESVTHCIQIISVKYFKPIISNAWYAFMTVQATMLIFLLVKFHDVFMMPSELKNVDNLICKVEKVYDTNEFEILYANDKYIFAECHKFSKDWRGKPTQSEIRIFKFEELFDDTACNGNKRIRDAFVKDSIADSKKPAFIN
ncbi:hypothetical protein [Flavobacterium sp. AED]|uniref:hypothetical protein n=1 Tax=Flavobacterium sp. AED TaxID=1423323 RepID=UPI0005809816|nr:hypothetical protein [Flavobacterium sp. AED]KIA82454.1 hypothetical protein OA85_16450 [Flavobacterium sp. AED]